MFIGKRDIWVQKYRDTGYLGGKKLSRYGIFKKRFQTPHSFFHFAPLSRLLITLKSPQSFDNSLQNAT